MKFKQLHNLNSLSGKEIVKKIVNLAKNLQSTGNFTSGERILLIMKDSPEFVYSFLALISIGCIPVPINPLIKDSELEYILEDSKAIGVIIDDQQYHRLYGVVFHSSYIIPACVTVNLFLQNECFTSTCLLQYLDEPNGSSDLDFIYEKNNPIAFWQYTSGTTGKPKAVQHTHHTMLFNTNMFAKKTLKICPSDIIMSVSKMFFGYGLGNSIFFPLLTGASVVIDKEWFSIDNLKKNISLYQPTLFFGTPKVYLDILQNENKFSQKDFTNIKLFISAGSALPHFIKKNWKARYGKTIVNGIGSTEIGHIFLCDHEIDEINENVLGVPVEGYEVKICKTDNPEEEVNSCNEIGEMCICPPSNAVSSYWNMPEANREKYKENWYLSGDLCSKTQQGVYLYHGRKDDLFKVNGRWVSSWEIENIILNEFYEVSECALTFHLDANELPSPILYVVSKMNTDVIDLENRIYSILKLKVSSYKLPSKIFFIEELPRNSNGKVNKEHLVKDNIN
ncbi:AMP-binding protein [Chryseobacterium nematophagum]|uniref:AMP-binding protein n=1 Tax=Chryseobacterium nematophagum TaxID=2305228 RepID=UPI001E41E314|nr:AMP-binding protein [Chryseobacterium nematophagum]